MTRVRGCVDRSTTRTAGVSGIDDPSRRAKGRPPAHNPRHESTHLAAHAVAVREVAALEHELGDDAVEAGALVGQVLAGDGRLALLACFFVGRGFVGLA